MITLSKDMEVGIALIDKQHRGLIDRLNEITELCTKRIDNKAETKKTLDLLADYVVKHFKDEEEIMAKTKYPQLALQKQQHAQYIAELNALQKEFAANGQSHRFSLELRNSIIDWIVKHIKSSDLAFGRYYRDNCK